LVLWQDADTDIYGQRGIGEGENPCCVIR
jgi:hypothetical protein